MALRILRSGAGMAGLTEASKIALYLRKKAFQLRAVQWIGELAVGRDLADRIELENYE